VNRSSLICVRPEQLGGVSALPDKCTLSSSEISSASGTGPSLFEIHCADSLPAPRHWTVSATMTAFVRPNCQARPEPPVCQQSHQGEMESSALTVTGREEQLRSEGAQGHVGLLRQEEHVSRRRSHHTAATPRPQP
jgi:hypothetical protein